MRCLLGRVSITCAGVRITEGEEEGTCQSDHGRLASRDRYIKFDLELFGSHNGVFYLINSEFQLTDVSAKSLGKHLEGHHTCSFCIATIST